jgi:hypothetical protein
MNNNSANGSFHRCSDLQEAIAQGTHLRSLKFGSGSLASNLLHHYVGGCCQQDAKLIGLEISATGAVDLKSMMQFFDIIFHIPTAAIDFVNPLRLEREVGDDVAGIIPSLTTGITNNLSFDNQSAGLFPCLSLIKNFRKQSFGLARNGGKNANGSHERFDMSRKGGIAGEANQVFDMLPIQVIKDGRSGKTAFAGLPETVHASMKLLCQRKFVIDSFQQNGTAIRTTVGLIKGDRDGFVKFFAEKNRLCGKLSHQKASVCVCNLIAFNYLYARGGLLFDIFMNNLD